MIDLGKIAMRPKGEFQSGTNYERLDFVSYEGSSYLALKDTAVEPFDDGVNWMLIAEKGKQGNDGKSGISPQLIEAPDEDTALLLSMANPGNIYFVEVPE